MTRAIGGRSDWLINSIVSVPVIPALFPWARRSNSLLALCCQIVLLGPLRSLSSDWRFPAAL